MRDALEHKIDAAEEPVTRAIRRVNGVREHSDRPELARALEHLSRAREELERAARAEDGCVCRRCGEYYREDEMEYEVVPQWGGKQFVCCPHCGSHKQEI